MAWLEVIATMTTSGVSLGGGFAWLWKQWKDFRSEIQAELKECRDDRELSDQRRNALIVVIELLWQAVERHAPQAPELKRGKQLMDDYKAIGKGK